jgi:hypothetical protein
MIKLLTAYTEEIDNVEAAVSSLLGQLALKDNLQKNSVALIHCYYEFVDSGLVEELDRRLGIPTMGTTVVALSVPGHTGEMGLSVIVLTSDDIRFSSGISESGNSDEISKSIADVYKKVTEGFDSKPALLFAFPPLMSAKGFGGDVFIAELNNLLDGGIPVFGALPSTNETTNGEINQVFYRGKSYVSEMVLLAFYGDVNPLFYTVALTEKALNTKRGRITSSRLNIIESINDMPANKYAESIGLSTFSLVETMPLVIHADDGSKIFRACMEVLDNGSLRLTGIVPEKAEISFSFISDKDVVESTRKTIENIVKSKAVENRSCLIYSCCSRFWVLGSNRWAEIDTIDSHISPNPWCFAYIGGEPFPSMLPDGTVSNLLQNYSLTICVL